MSDATPAAGEDLEPRPTTPLARRAGASVSVYAAVTGLAGAVPVPLLDGVLSELARGAAMRRVASRHGVTLTPDARELLSGQGSIHATSTGRGRLLKTALASVVAPFRVAARIEDAFGTLFTAVLLDHYLGRPSRPRGRTLTADEARRVRSATEHAIADAGFDALRSVPLGFLRVLKHAFDEAVQSDPERRSAVERFVDALLDGLADAPAELNGTLIHHFDEALARDVGTP